MRRIALALCATAFAAAAALAAPIAPERVSFDSLDRGADGKPVRITALRYAPQGEAITRGAVANGGSSRSIASARAATTSK